jgi:predicted Rossmann fold flavoprotein
MRKSGPESNAHSKVPHTLPPQEDKIWDLVIVGGGPAGMICAGRAAERGLSVLLLEKNENLGKKLLITGGGRCNVTNSEFDTRTLLSKYKESDKFLFSPFSQFGVAETLDFFHSFGMDTKVEHEKRTFPVSDSSSSVLSVLVQYMQKHKVTVRTNSQVKHIHTNDATYTGQTCTIESLELTDGSIIRGLEFVIATGGKSRPETGSTGDGFSWAKKLGHTVEEPQASLVPLVSKDAWISKLSGISLPDVKIKVLLDSIPQGKAVKGKILFTHRGLSGPGILNLSKSIGELLQYGDVQVSLDLIPTKDIGTLDSLLNTLFRTEINKKLKNCLGTISSIAGVPEIVNSMKDFRINIQELMGTDKAIVTSGGVILTEIDPRTLRSRKCTNLFLIGDMLHIDRPSGGYSLQLCWTTGYVAGSSAGNKFPLS